MFAVKITYSRLKSFQYLYTVFTGNKHGITHSFLARKYANLAVGKYVKYETCIYVFREVFRALYENESRINPREVITIKYNIILYVFMVMA